MTVVAMTAGKPWNYSLRFKDVGNIWNSVSELEVRGQLRTNDKSTGLLISNLQDYMTLAFDGEDLVVSIAINGDQTRALYSKQWGYNKTGYVNFTVSDIGTVDSRLLVVPVIQIVAKDTTTKATGVS